MRRLRKFLAVAIQSLLLSKFREDRMIRINRIKNLLELDSRKGELHTSVSIPFPVLFILSILSKASTQTT